MHSPTLTKRRNGKQRVVCNCGYRSILLGDGSAAAVLEGHKLRNEEDAVAEGRERATRYFFLTTDWSINVEASDPDEMTFENYDDIVTAALIEMKAEIERVAVVDYNIDAEVQLELRSNNTAH